MPVAVGDVIRITARMKWNAVIDVQNTFHAQLGSGAGMSNGTAKADLAEWVDDIYTEIVGALPSTLSFEDIDFYNITDDEPMGTESWPTLTYGTGSSEVSATGVAYVITAFTNVVRIHGRKFFGPAIEAAVEGGVFDATTMAYLASVILVWILPFSGGTSSDTWTPGVYSRLTTLFHEFRDAVVRNIPGYQRRRKQNVGS